MYIFIFYISVTFNDMQKCQENKSSIWEML